MCIGGLGDVGQMLQTLCFLIEAGTEPMSVTSLHWKAPWEAHLACTQELVSWSLSEFSTVHTVKGFGIVNKAEIDDFWNSLAFIMIQRMLAIWSLVLLPFQIPA